MRFRIGGVASVAAAVLFLSAPTLAQSAPTRVFDGAGFSAQPSSIGRWVDKSMDPNQELLVGGLSGTAGEYGSIKWKFWRKKKAVGVGAGHAPGCGSPCDVSNPWDEGRVRVTAYGRHGGKFRRLKIHQWTNWMTGQAALEENYKMSLAFKRGHWVVTEIDDGRY